MSMNKVLSEHSRMFVYVFSGCLCATMTKLNSRPKTTQLTRSKPFALWPFTENGCRPLA